MPLNNDLRKEWDLAGYRTDMGSAAVVRPPSKEYIRVYHVMPAEFAISNIAFKRMKVARVKDLNDPFEFLGLNLRQKQIRTIVEASKENLQRDTGLLCFSADWTSPALWSHYGANQTGICLGFDLRRSQVVVILGHRCAHTVEAILEVMSPLYRGPVVFKARLASGVFKIVPEESTVPPRIVGS